MGRPGDQDQPGNQRKSEGGRLSWPAFWDSSYVSALPSANLRVHFTDRLQLRLAASQSLTRPNFSQLSPALTLVPAQGQGGGGNPNLKPLRADAFDASLDYRSEEHTSELQSLMPISSVVFCLKK